MGSDATSPRALPFDPSSSSSSLSSWVAMIVTGLAAVVLAIHYGTSSSTPKATTAEIDACNELLGRFGSNLIVTPSATNYTTLSEENWSQTSWHNPTCIALLTTATEISSLVSFLVDSQVPFAVRSGGHSPNPFDASIENGVLISLDNLDEISYDPGTELITLGPGARWDPVYDELDKYNRSMVGGRVTDVGVGGLSLGSGLSYLTDLYGLVCDNIISYEVVLADGSVVAASTASNPDLFWALKGGTNNFGIVTKFVARTYPIYNAWGGILLYSSDQVPALLQALYEYETQPNKDPYANMIINLIPTNTTNLLTLIYLKPVDMPAAYAPFFALTPIFQQTGFATLHELMNLFPPTDAPRWTWFTQTFEPDATLYSEIAELYASAPEVQTIGSLPGTALIAAVQPIAASAVVAGRESNGGTGNALGLQAVNQVWWTVTVSWADASDDATVYAAGASFKNKIAALASARNVSLEYIFMNDANIEQPVIVSYGSASLERLRSVQKGYDPELVFQRLVPGGQKIPAE
ncbi:putative FAD-binding oxidoreductase [Xylariaceae sp. FL1272]|nr:putative FAD-binding oxidoreductase [Xylariaceae sp. FL1272]